MQLGRFELEVLGYAKAAMNADVATAMRKLTPIDFHDEQYPPQPVDASRYTMVGVKKTSGGDY